MKQLDPLEQFIVNHREKLFPEKAPPAAWDKISAKLDTPAVPRNPYRTAFWILVAAILAIVSYWYYAQTIDREPQQTMEYAAIPDFDEVQSYYRLAVDQKMEELYKVHDDATIDDDLSLLDQMEAELRKEYQEAQGPFREMILSALIDNYQTRLALLQKVLEEVKAKELSESIYHEM